jgi:hypothetical protein
MLAEDERRGAFSAVSCARCGAEVLAVKFSAQHTSVQWTAGAVGLCAEFSVAGRPSALVEGCGSLRSSLFAAVADGRLEVSPP